VLEKSDITFQVQVTEYMDNLVRINKELVPRAAASCARAFEDDALFVSLIPDKDKRANLRYSFEFYIRGSLYSGSEAYATSEQCEGIAIWHASERKEPWDLIFHCGNPFLPLRCGFRFVWADMRANNLCKKLRDKLAPRPHMYLVALGVDPSHQAQGLASALIKPMLKRLDQSGTACVLETQNAKNVGMYRYFGFETVYQGIFPGSQSPLFMMIRNPALYKP
jgi:ribosomal protein S18 acetylase RimI-like enzyme